MSRPFPSPPETVQETLSRAARAFPDRGIQLVEGRRGNTSRRTYAELPDAMIEAARKLAGAGVRPGDRVIVCLPTSWDWIDSWLGTVALGALPVAAAPPGALGSARAALEKIERISDLLEARKIVCADRLVTEAQSAGLGGLVRRAITPDKLNGFSAAALPTAHEPDPGSVAFLQLTSGSTGIPRAVSITHHGLVHNSIASGRAIADLQGAPAHQWADTMVSWLPLYHDMGLVGGVFFSLINGVDLTLLNPRLFLGRPASWLHAIQEAGEVISPAPNFAYQMCVERLGDEAVGNLNLRGWKAAMTGSEMVHDKTMRRFAERFAPAGLAATSLRPCYGMAEATLSITFDRRGEGVRTQVPERGLTIDDAGSGLVPAPVVSNGVPVMDTKVRVVAADGADLPDRSVGEVEMQGPGLFAGYYNDPVATKAAFREDWFRTGDLGFVDDGELYLTGRTKEILILRGQNFMPHEIEWVAEQVVGAGGSQRSGAFSVEGEAGEQAVLVLEVDTNVGDRLGELEREVRNQVGRALSLQLADVAFVRRGRIPKTSSGKVRRRRLKEQYASGEIERMEGHGHGP